MRKNRSPWLHQLNKDREHAVLKEDIKTDVAIVGAGIAGIATAFFALKYTDKKVVVLEKYKLAHGATGHNAGQVVSYFEKGFKNMAEEFGLSLARDGQMAIEHAWNLLEEMYAEAKLDISFEKGPGHDGYSTYEQVIAALEDFRCKREAGVPVERMAIATNAPFIDSMPEVYAGLWHAMPQPHILEMLETENTMFFAASSHKKGVVNSALFCEKILHYLLEAYPDRFALFEHAPVHKLILHEHGATLDVESHMVECSRVVLCTNGFENLHIINHNGLEVDARYHHLLRGRVAYMSAYLEEDDKPAVALGYQTPEQPTDDLPYYYLTRRPYEHVPGTMHTLVSVGGPEEAFSDEEYSREREYPEEPIAVLDHFVRTIYEPGRKDRVEYEFTWHGLMGYTANGIRMIGPEPKNPVLLYNLGCNGVGILPSVFGGRKIARHLAGEKVPPSIFDVPARVPSELPVGSPKVHA